MPQARIRTSFGDIHIAYGNIDELKAALATVQEESDLIRNAVASIVPNQPRSPKPGCEGIYRFTPEGNVELLASTSKALHTAVLVLYAHHPDLVAPARLEDATGLPGVVGKVLSQTLNKNYFRKVDDSYGLSADGFIFCQEKVIPGLQKPAPEIIQK
jgi:hypothetical protein